ncbi:hypothetical protein AMTRI_Chr04g243550 [Amborella trichopoda]|uniref:EF-hand domain-containing protein n=1 Tax=Amborella trichopoda TaxID=13333 RepID=W1PU14_AMBTC|nr:uncharacterized protein LOC18439351 [Amborella trichopoda]ERN11161.1 hypothetical protein AMTR_s00024p00192350 [Amborella trichopoda]|eukprot:XP_006849580.1 uncharacterized protein LOC18439351 [Amborella trichopoda]
MSVAILDGSTVRDFVEDLKAFNESVNESFSDLDIDHDGVLSRSELRRAFECLRLLESDFGSDSRLTPEELTRLYDSVFDKFDYDHSGAVDLEEFRSEMREIMLATADGLGAAPVEIVLEEGSFLLQAVKHENEKNGEGVN